MLLRSILSLVVIVDTIYGDSRVDVTAPWIS